MISLERLEQSPEERAIRDEEIDKVVRWVEKRNGLDPTQRAWLIHELKRSAHRD